MRRTPVFVRSRCPVGAELVVYIQGQATPLIEAENKEHVAGSIGFRQVAAGNTSPKLGPVAVKATQRAFRSV